MTWEKYHNVESGDTVLPVMESLMRRRGWKSKRKCVTNSKDLYGS